MTSIKSILLYYNVCKMRRPAPPVSALVAEHLLRGAALLLGGGRLALDGPAWLRALGLLTAPLRSLRQGGDLAAFGRRHGPPGQSRGLQLVVHGVDQSGDIDEVGDRLRSRPPAGAHRLRDEFGGPVVQHGGAADGVKGDCEDGVVQTEGPVAGRQVAHGNGLQAGELGGGVAGDDVGHTHRAVG